MKKRKNWRDGSTAAQKRHLKENQIVHRRDMEETRRVQLKMAADSAYPERETCFECRSIAIRAGIES